jgi:hypothetical protein
MAIHFASFGLYQVSPNGSIYQHSNTNRSIKDYLNFRTEHRVIPDNTSGYPRG